MISIKLNFKYFTYKITFASMTKQQKLRREPNNNLLTSQNSSSKKKSKKELTLILSLNKTWNQQDMASDLDDSELLHTDKYPTLSTDTTENKDTEDTYSSNSTRADKPQKIPKLQVKKYR